jgi:hypothetical protein
MAFRTKIDNNIIAVRLLCDLLASREEENTCSGLRRGDEEMAL